MRAVATAVSILVLTAAVPARAACPPADPATLTERQAALERIFEDHAGDMDLWWTGFMGLHMGMVVAGGVIAQQQQGDARNETLVSLLGSALGAGTLLVVTPPLLEAPTRLAPLPLDTPAQQAAWVALAERMLAEQARKSRFAKSWLARGLAFAYGVGASLVVWLAFHRPWGALRQLVGGTIIGQGRIWLHPSGAADAWDAYRGRYLGDCGAAALEPRARPPISVSVGAAAGGFGLSVRF